MTNLNPELPLGANRNAWDGAVVIGGNNGALLGSTNTGHSLKWKMYVIFIHNYL